MRPARGRAASAARWIVGPRPKVSQAAHSNNNRECRLDYYHHLVKSLPSYLFACLHAMRGALWHSLSVHTSEAGSGVQISGATTRVGSTRSMEGVPDLHVPSNLGGRCTCGVMVASIGVSNSCACVPAVCCPQRSVDDSYAQFVRGWPSAIAHCFCLARFGFGMTAKLLLEAA